MMHRSGKDDLRIHLDGRRKLFTRQNRKTHEKKD